MVADVRLGDFSVRLTRFSDLDIILDAFATNSFLSLSPWKKEEKIHALLLKLIQEEPTPCFLLGAVNEFIEKILAREWLSSYPFAHFEFWLNHCSGLDNKDNYLVRAKIVGRYIPRESYQVLFPVGMGKVHTGSHYVTAHGSPDLDTTVASFWGWVDAFGARVSDGLHLWNVPGGPPTSQIEIQFLFQNLFGGHFFDHFAKTRTSLALSCMDLLTQKTVLKKGREDSVQSIDDEPKEKAVILVDEEGYYVGDWRPLDGEMVRKVTVFLNNCMRWFGSVFQQRLTSLFAEPHLKRMQITDWVNAMFCLRLEESEPVKESTERQRSKLDAYLTDVLQVKKGQKSTFGEFWNDMEALPLEAFSSFRKEVESLFSLFDAQGILLENRSLIFSILGRVIESLEKTIQSMRKYVDQLGVAFKIKKAVYAEDCQGIGHRAEVEEIRNRLGSLPYLTVTASHSDGRESVLGIIKSSMMHKSLLGTVSLRDFCNREETKVPSYFEVISVIDHHKSMLMTGSALTGLIADSQSANSLVAEMSFILNDQYGCSGCSLKEIEQQIEEAQKTKQGTLLQRLWQKQIILQRQAPYFVDTNREFLEYLHYIYAILDDTDLLSKVSYRDIICVATLLNRMKTLVECKEQEVISFADIPLDEHFVRTAAKRTLQNPDMYSLYQKIYVAKEQAILRHLELCVRGESNTLFADTKEQNGCCRVGQTKLFGNNFPDYLAHAEAIRLRWYETAKVYHQEKGDCDLYMHMISTVPSAEKVYSGAEGGYSHLDELWIWIPETEQAIEHLKSFLNAFRSAPQVASASMEVEFVGANVSVLEEVFAESFMPISRKPTDKKGKMPAPVAVLRYRAGLLNSRKAMISPYLPKLIH